MFWSFPNIPLIGEDTQRLIAVADSNLLSIPRSVVKIADGANACLRAPCVPAFCNPSSPPWPILSCFLKPMAAHHASCIMLTRTRTLATPGFASMCTRVRLRASPAIQTPSFLFRSLARLAQPALDKASQTSSILGDSPAKHRSLSAPRIGIAVHPSYLSIPFPIASLYVLSSKDLSMMSGYLAAHYSKTKY